MYFQPLNKGIGRAVAERTVLRRNAAKQWETWGDVATRVAFGNASLRGTVDADEFDALRRHIANGTILMSGRSLQHGDGTQITRPQEVFTNCSTAVLSSLSYYLLLQGSGVGRLYDDAVILTNWDLVPDFICVLDRNHPDWIDGTPTPEQVASEAGYGQRFTFIVPDSREGWAQAVEVLEDAAAGFCKGVSQIVLDFSEVRPKGSPIGGMQNRPASGPVPFMEALNSIKASVMGRGMEPWEQEVWVDHFLAECVLVGGARRAARIAMKVWTDPGVIKFMSLKHANPGSLWSANYSVLVDAEFWRQTAEPGSWGHQVFLAAVEAAYYHGTGEPGFINYDKLPVDNSDMDALSSPDAFASNRFRLGPTSATVMARILEIAKTYKVQRVVNPCGEVQLAMWGAFCVIGDLAPYNAESLDDAMDAARVLTRALMRLNTMDSIYNGEVERTQRIGVSLTGIHEAAFKWFGYGFRDMLDVEKSRDWWMFIKNMSDAACDEAHAYALVLGVNAPHSVLTIKPAGTTSKLFGLTEGAHLTPRKYYLRWVQFVTGDPAINEYREKGFPVRELVDYKGTTIVGFPTVPTITTLGMGDKLVTASEATPDEHFQWLRLLEYYWLGAGRHDKGGQVSYTLKYDPKIMSFDEFKEMIARNQPTVRCCSVLPEADKSAYEYLPEEELTEFQFRFYTARIRAMGGADMLPEAIGEEHLICAGGACPL